MSFFSRLFGGKKPQPAPAPSPTPVQPAATEVYNFRHIKDLSNVSALETCSRPENADFQQLLSKHFADCTISKAVAASELFSNAPAYAMPVNFFITKGDKRLAVVLMDARRTRRYSYLETRELCKEAGIEFMPFFFHLPNEEDYVVQRIKSVLG